jgi:mono/diheme cytochrome c family protein
MMPMVVNAAEGEGLFVQKCGACHKKGGSAASVNPADKAATVWDKYFSRGRHPVDMGVGDAELQQVLQYLQAHAADSDQPAAAVIPK